MLRSPGKCSLRYIYHVGPDTSCVGDVGLCRYDISTPGSVFALYHYD